jgi:hypothetical protein
MKSKTKREVHRFPLSLLHYGNSYYIERIAALERALARKPRQLQIDMLGEGEIPADWALLIRSILHQRAAKTQVTTNARSSLQNGSVLVWLLGDRRIIRDDARIFFRRAKVSAESNSEPEKVWDEDDMKYADSFSEADPDEADHAKVLQHINEFLPVNKLVGRVIDVSTLRQFGLAEHDKLDAFLATAFAPSERAEVAQASRAKRVANHAKAAKSVQSQH